MLLADEKFGIIALVKGLLFIDTGPLLEPVINLCGQFTNMLEAMLFLRNASLLLLVIFILLL